MKLGALEELPVIAYPIIDVLLSKARGIQQGQELTMIGAASEAVIRACKSSRGFMSMKRPIGTNSYLAWQVQRSIVVVYSGASIFHFCTSFSHACPMKDDASSVPPSHHKIR